MSDPSGPERVDPPPSFQVRIPLEWDESTPIDTVYANQVLISHGGPEFSLLFGFVVPPINAAELPDSLRIQPQVRVVIAREAMPTIVQALNENLRRFRESATKSGQPGPSATGTADPA